VHSLTRFANSAIHQNVAEDSAYVRLEAIVDGRPAAATTTRTDRRSVARLVSRVLDAARRRPPDPDWPGLAPPAPLVGQEHYDAETAEATPDQRAEVVRAFVDAGDGLEAAGYCSTTAMTVGFANSAGQRLESRSSSAEVDGVQRAGTADGSSSQTSSRLADLDGEAAGRRAAQKARAASTAIEIEPMEYEVVLEPACVANILQFLALAGFNGKSCLEKTSFVRLGEQQFDPSVGIWDDAADPRTIGLLFDSDGTPKRRLDLVAGGVTTGIVHDRRTARQAGAETTGHSVGQESFGAFPSNLFFGEGGLSAEELIGGVERGLLVTDFWYTRILDPKTQVVTGLTRNGLFIIDDGTIRGSAHNLRFTQSFVTGLGPGRVRAIGNDGRLVGRMHVPSVNLASWHFTGGSKG
jgi:predicted Zn-dependent protease